MTSEEATISRASLLEALKSGEEYMEDEELTACLESILGFANEGGKWEARPDGRAGGGAAAAGGAGGGGGGGGGGESQDDRVK